MFIQTEETPNPATLKFIPGKTVMDTGTAEFTSKDDAKGCLLAEKLFDIRGITGVFFGTDFITLTKMDVYDWLILKPSVLGAIMEYFMAYDSVTFAEIKAEESVEVEYSDPETAEIVAEIKELIETHVRPAVAQDGGDITFEKFSAGVVYLRLKGACSGCPSSSLTLKSGIENMLRHYIPEVEEVRAVDS